MSDISPAIRRMREKWRYTGKTRPHFAVEPEHGQESVWDYPRPPRIALDPRRIQVSSGGTVIADSQSCIRVLETASPPVFYLPMSDVRREFLEPSPTSTLCEWKGGAAYWSVHVNGRTIQDAAWGYPDPFESFESMADYVSFYPAKLDCLVDAERVEPQPGGFYGGWVTSEIVGPFKGEPGTGSW